MRVTFVSLDRDFLELVSKKGYNTFHGKVQDYDTGDSAKIYYVSPSNCLNFMDGGIDYAYSRVMFPGIEAKIKNEIKQLGFKTLLGRPYLPIGKAIVTKTDVFSKTNEPCYIISSPTMLLPQDISKTGNAFFSTLAVVQLLKKIKYEHNIGQQDELVLTSHCCGYGKMSIEESTKQMIQALEHPKPEKIIMNVQKIVEHQPNYYENSEWKKIPSDQIIKS